MKVHELITKLNEMPKDMEVFINITNDEFEFSQLEEVYQKNVLFSEGDGNPDTEAYEDVVILSDNL